MRVLAVVGQKGGIGKSTTVMNLAACMSRSSSVAVIDVDPQASTTKWAERAGENLPFDFTSETDISMLSLMRQLDYDVVIVDTPGSLADRDVLSALLDQTDYAIAPLSPSFMEIEPVQRTLQDFVIPRGIPYRVLMNKVDLRDGKGDLESFEELLDTGSFFDGQVGIPRFKNYIRQAKVMKMMPLQGTVITDYSDTRNSRAAISDYTSVALELMNLWARERKTA
ncbi:ParA family protein [Microbacterium sp. LMI1-1-1.1]